LIERLVATDRDQIVDRALIDGLITVAEHIGNTLAAAAGVSTRDLMARMGHDIVSAAIIYQHGTREADHVIADALDAGMRALLEASTKATRGLAEGNRRGFESTR
jgi:hypothetical protein